LIDRLVIDMLSCVRKHFGWGYKFLLGVGRVRANPALHYSILYNCGMVIATNEITVDRTNLLDRLTSLCKEHYGARLISLAVFGSVGRGTPRPVSDIDLLLVVKDLPNGRIARVKEFAPVEIALSNAIKTHFDLSPVFKTPEEIADGSPLLLDMVEDSRILFDRDDFFQRALKNLNDNNVWERAAFGGERLVLGSETRLQARGNIRDMKNLSLAKSYLDKTQKRLKSWGCYWRRTLIPMLSSKRRKLSNLR
jgi:hypothetical protein